MLLIFIGIIISYLIGSIPTAYIFGRLFKGIDIRQHGSGNIGATNALRVLGKKAGIAVLLLDIFKGFWTVVFLGNFIVAKNVPANDELLRILLGLACVSGHVWSVFLKFKGGKGMATTLGVFLGLATQIAVLKVILGLSVLAWLVVFLVFRIVSLASIASAIILPVLVVIFKQSPTLIILGLILSALVILRHKSNIQRLLQGKEKRI